MWQTFVLWIKKVATWKVLWNVLAIVGAVAIAVYTNGLAATWAMQPSRFNIYLLYLVVPSMLTFVSFGEVTRKYGVTGGSSIVDALLSTGTTLMGIFWFKEKNTLLWPHWLAVLFTISSVLIWLLVPRRGA